MTAPDRPVEMLARYFMWCEALDGFHRWVWADVTGNPRLWEELETASGVEQDAFAAAVVAKDPHRILAAVAYSSASLYVVIEGYRELGLEDSEIDALLESPLVDVLRKYRNGVFHFQRTFTDRRFLEVLDAGPAYAEWAAQLRAAFQRLLVKLAPEEMAR